MKEAARLRRLRELEEKRLAWVGVERSQGFSRSSSESDVEMLTKDGLLDFFKQRSQSPNSPLARSASARRHRHTMTSTADRELQGYLELFGGCDSDSKFNSLPRSGRTVQRRTTPWILTQDANRELGRERQLTSPCAQTEPISPLAVFSSCGTNDNMDPCNNNNNKYTSVSEGSALPHSFFVFKKSAHLSIPTVTGHMNVNVEKHTLVPGPQTFELPSPNNNSKHMHFVNQGDMAVTSLETGRGSSPTCLDLPTDHGLSQGRTDSAQGWESKIDCHTKTGPSPDTEKEEEEEDSTVSSTTCDTPLPLDTSVSNRKPVFYIIDCTETDCSVTLDYSEAEPSSLTKEGLHLRATDYSRDQESQQEPSSLSSNLESPKDQCVTSNELSAPKSVDTASKTASGTTEEWDKESCDTADGKQSSEKDTQKNVKKPIIVKNKTTKAVRAVRTLTSSENQGMRKVVPISKPTRTGSNKCPERTQGNESADTHRPPRDQSTPARGRSEKTSRPLRHSSLPPDESKAPRASSLSSGVPRWARDSTPGKASIHKPSAKPLRNISRPPPEEKICRSTMRALAQAQAQAEAQAGGHSENSSSQTLSSKNTSDLPNFARNTIASTTRTRKELGPPSVPSTPTRSPTVLVRQPVIKQRLTPVVPSGEESQGTSLRRVQSVRSSSRRSYRSETPPPAIDNARKTSSFSEKSLTINSRNTKPTWK